MKKNFVFDTNVLLTDPHALYKFGDNNVVVPITVIEELDNFKHDNNTLGRNAREATRIIDAHRGQGNLSKGVALEGGGILRVLTNLGQEPPLPFPVLHKTADGLILATALTLKKKEELPVILVTRDTNLRLRADAVGLTAETYKEE
jgi:PhoH-like ATPase